MRVSHPGSIKFRLVEMLCREFGALFSPYDLSSSNPMHIRLMGLCVWDCFGQMPNSLLKVHVYSWDTMTNCARYGFEAIRHPRDIHDYELVAKKP